MFSCLVRKQFTFHFIQNPNSPCLEFGTTSSCNFTNHDCLEFFITMMRNQCPNLLVVMSSSSIISFVFWNKLLWRVWIITIVNDPSIPFLCGGSFGCHFCFSRCSSQQEKLSLVDGEKHKKENPPTIACEELKIYAIALYLLFSKKCSLQILTVRWKWLPITITSFFAWWSVATMS